MFASFYQGFRNNDSRLFENKNNSFKAFLYGSFIYLILATKGSVKYIKIN
jgi:hypothetical protein